MVLSVLPEDPFREQILRMKAEQARVRRQNEITKTIRNATKNATRLRKRARLMAFRGGKVVRADSALADSPQQSEREVLLLAHFYRPAAP